MEIKKGTKLKLKWQFLNEGEPVSLSDYSKFRLDVLDIKKVPQRTSVTLAENEVVFSIDTEKYENGRFSVRVDADGPDGGLHICHRAAFRIVPANAKSSLAKGGPGENYELTIQDDLSGQTQSVVEEQDPTVPDHVKNISQQNVDDLNGIFIVHYKLIDGINNLDKTYSQIVQAYNEGKCVLLYVDIRIGGTYHYGIYSLSEVYASYVIFVKPGVTAYDGSSSYTPMWFINSDNSANPAYSHYKIRWDDIFGSIDTNTALQTAFSLKQNKLPSLEGNAGKVLRVKSDETDVEWVSID